MSLLYRVTTKRNPQNPEGQPKYYIVPMSRGSISFDKLLERASKGMTVMPGEIRLALDRAIDVPLRPHTGHLHLRQPEEGVWETLLGRLGEKVVGGLRIGGVQSNSPLAELGGIGHATCMSQRTIRALPSE